MGYKLSFMDNQVYSAQDVNEHFSKLFSGGVSLTESGNILADLNRLTGDITTYGVLQDACLVVKTDTGYKISAGTAFMHDGSAITFDADGYSFSASGGKYWYVYLQRNEAQNRIDIVVSETEPYGNVVLLANISTAGIVYDRRDFARLKVNTSQANTLRKLKYSCYASEDYRSKTYDIGSNFEYFGVTTAMGYTTSKFFTVSTRSKNLYMISDGEEIYISLVDNGGMHACGLTVKRAGNTLELKGFDNSYVSNYDVNFVVI